jgi:hypothetical protein
MTFPFIISSNRPSFVSIPLHILDCLETSCQRMDQCVSIFTSLVVCDLVPLATREASWLHRCRWTCSYSALHTRTLPVSVCGLPLISSLKIHLMHFNSLPPTLYFWPNSVAVGRSVTSQIRNGGNRDTPCHLLISLHPCLIGHAVSSTITL